LIVRPDNLGDVVLFSGALRAIREKWAASRITICVKRFVTDYLALCPYVDDILVWEDVSNFLYYPCHKRQVLRLTRRTAGSRLDNFARSAFDSLTKCDLFFDLLLFPVRSPSWDYHMFARAVQVPVRIGISGDWCNQTPAQDRAAENIYTARLNVPSRRKWDSELQINAEFLRFLGMEITQADISPEAWTNGSDSRWARDQICSNDVPGCFRLGIIAGVNSPEMKMYPAEKIAEAISMISDAKFSCVILGSTKDVITSNEVEKSLRPCSNVVTITNLAGQTNVRQLIECLRLCDIVLSVDSAPLHLATALGKSTVGIIGGGHYGRFYPWGDPEINRVASLPMDCYGCNWRCPRERAPCVSGVPPTTIARELQYLLDRLKH
ncbi:MAG: glycosyltransferase family 9 protein, partial [Desulfomonilaceae bacterium]